MSEALTRRIAEAAWMVSRTALYGEDHERDKADIARAVAPYVAAVKADGYNEVAKEADGLRRDKMIAEGTIRMAVDRLEGLVEERPTHEGNFLQRIDELRDIERERDSLRAEVARLRELEAKAGGCACEQANGPTCHFERHLECLENANYPHVVYCITDGKPCCTKEDVCTEHPDDNSCQLNGGAWTCSVGCWDTAADWWDLGVHPLPHDGSPLRAALAPADTEGK